MIFYGNIQIPRISGNFDACADSVYQALFPRKKGSLGSRLRRPFSRQTSPKTMLQGQTAG